MLSIPYLIPCYLYSQHNQTNTSILEGGGYDAGWGSCTHVQDVQDNAGNSLTIFAVAGRSLGLVTNILTRAGFDYHLS